MGKVVVSGFADEIDQDFDKQLRVVTDLGMDHICLRSADRKGVAEYTADEFAEQLWPRMQAAGVKLSSIGSPVGKIPVNDDAAFEEQKEHLEELCRMCKIAGCNFIRVFSFFMPEGEDPDTYKDQVIAKFKQLVEIAECNDVILIHENEKEIYGDIARRCADIFENVPSDHLKAAFDFANFVQVGQDPTKAWELLHEHVAYIHIKDALYSNDENVLFGTGDGDGAALLKRAIVDEGYEGFLTLEPHLVLFDSLKSLETKNTADIIHENKARDGEDAYAQQFHALTDILENVGLVQCGNGSYCVE